MFLFSQATGCFLLLYGRYAVELYCIVLEWALPEQTRCAFLAKERGTIKYTMLREQGATDWPIINCAAAAANS